MKKIEEMTKKNWKITHCNFACLCKLDRGKIIYINLKKKKFTPPCEILQLCAKWSKSFFTYCYYSLWNFVWLCGNVGACPKWPNLMQNCVFGPSSIFFLNLKVFKIPIRVCQVSTWPYPINRNLNFSLRTFWHFWYFWFWNFLETFYLSLSIEFYIFLSFFLIFLVSKHALWDQIDYYRKVLFCRPNYKGFKHLWVVIIFI